MKLTEAWAAAVRLRRVCATLLAAGALAGGVVLLSAGHATLDRAAGDGGDRPAQVTLVYVGADDCAPCKVWQGEARAAFVASPEASRLVYREVKSPRLFDALKDEHWPDDMRVYRERLSRGDGLPVWFLVADGARIEKHAGLSQWQAAVLPRVRALTR